MNYNLDLHGGRLRRPISLPDPPTRVGAGANRVGAGAVWSGVGTLASPWLEDQVAPASWENPTTSFS